MKKFVLITAALAAFAWQPVFAGEGVALVIGSAEDPVNCISPVSINTVDGTELPGGRMQVTLEPGKHTLSGAAKVNTSFCSKVGVSRGGKKNAVAPLEAEFEAGKTYYLGLNHKASRETGWFYEIWKVEDSK